MYRYRTRKVEYVWESLGRSKILDERKEARKKEGNNWTKTLRRKEKGKREKTENAVAGRNPHRSEKYGFYLENRG